MNRRGFIIITSAAIAAAGTASYLLSDKTNFTRADIKGAAGSKLLLKTDEKEILYLASLAPSGHNTQPWLVKYIGPYHWIICHDKNKWLPAVDPIQRETILSIGAFIQNLEYAAGALNYSCNFTLLASTNEDENIMEVKLVKSGNAAAFDTKKIINRRTVRSNYLSDTLKADDVNFLLSREKDFIYYLPNNSKEHQWLNEQTIEANRIQAYRDDAQKELSEWMRLSSKEAEKYCDGLTTASMELEGIPGWVLRNFYDKEDVMKKGFREKSIDKVKTQVSQSAGWLLITSSNGNVATLLDTGKRMQRLFLKIRERNIAIHPMTQVLEEEKTRSIANQSLGIGEPIQFLLRAGYCKNYPVPVSLRRPVEWFVQT